MKITKPRFKIGDIVEINHPTFDGSFKITYIQALVDRKGSSRIPVLLTRTREVAFREYSEHFDSWSYEVEPLDGRKMEPASLNEAFLELDKNTIRAEILKKLLDETEGR